MTGDRSHAIVPFTLAERADALAELDLFEGLTHDELVQIAARAHVLAFAHGDVIVPQGEAGLGFYVIESGTADVERDGATVASLQRGDFFGEVSLLEWEPRNATVRATSDVRCIGILRSFFKGMLESYPRVAMRVLEQERGRRTVEPD
ncbi:MAG: cyclic nucleotide-binding domain-containing protein [Actinomycetota bacterium]